MLRILSSVLFVLFSTASLAAASDVELGRFVPIRGSIDVTTGGCNFEPVLTIDRTVLTGELLAVSGSRLSGSCTESDRASAKSRIYILDVGAPDECGIVRLTGRSGDYTIEILDARGEHPTPDGRSCARLGALSVSETNDGASYFEGYDFLP